MRKRKVYTPCEKQLEILFNHYFLSLFPIGGVTLFAPSAPVENKLGYDANFTGLNGCFELRLQFKRAKLLMNDTFKIDINQNQHKELTRWKANSAFYVASNFRTLADLQQFMSNTFTANDFLHRFIAVDAMNLANKKSIMFKNGIVDPPCWLYGDQLLDNFKNYQVGELIPFTYDDEPDFLPIDEREFARRRANFEALKNRVGDVAEESYLEKEAVGVRQNQRGNPNQCSLFRLIQPL